MTQKSQLQHHNSKRIGRISSLSSTEEKKADAPKEDKFSFQQRIESVKTAAVGALSVSCYAANKVSIVLHRSLLFSDSSFTTKYIIGRDSSYTIYCIS